MRRLALTTVAALLSFLVLAPPAWAEWVWPLRGEVITPYRNGDDPYAAGQHRGIDISGPPGAPVVAATAGVVRFAGVAGSSGLTVGVRTADGSFDTSYLHLSAVSVREGDHVAAGAALGAVGTSGRRSTEQPHLHFGVRDAGSRHGYRDPLAMLPPLPDSLPEPPAAVPGPAPAPLGPVPEPLGAPDGAPRAVPAPTLRPAPHPAPVPAPRRVPAASGRRETVRPGVAAPDSALAFAARHGVGTPKGVEPVDARTGGGGLGAAPAPAPLDAGGTPAPDNTWPAARGRGGGVDLGLVLACAGLFLAAAIFFFTGGGRRGGSAPSQLAALLRPLAGR